MKVFLFLLPADGGGAERKHSHAASLLKLRRCWDHSRSHSASQSFVESTYKKRRGAEGPTFKEDGLGGRRRERKREKKASQLNAFLCD